MVSWIAFKSFLKKAWAWCKKNWKIFLGAAIPIAILMIAGRSSSAKKMIAKIRDDYKKEIDVIDRAHEKEIEDIKLAEKRYVESVNRIEGEFLEKNEELDSKKKKEIQKIISENSDNPDEITRRIAEITGFEIHVS